MEQTLSIYSRRKCSFLLLGFSFFFLLHWWKRKEQEERFQFAYQQMLHFQKKVQKNGSQEERIQQLLSAFNFLNQALALQPDSEVCHQEKLRLSEQLISLACQEQNYSLADYILHELPEFLERDVTLRKKLEQLILQEKKSSLEIHERRFQFWLKQLREGDWSEGLKEDALFEICQLPEEAVFENLYALVFEGTEYFLQSLQRTERTEHFYILMATALGRRGNAKTIPLLRSSLQKISEHLFLMEKKPIADLEYLIAITNAMGYLKDYESEESLREIREKMGQNSYFWIRTEVAYQKLIEQAFIQGDPLKNLFLKGTWHLQAKDWTAAIQSFDHYLMQHPQEYAAYVHRGIARQNLKDWAGAIADYQKALQLNPNCVQAHINQGNIQVMLNDLSGAILQYNQAIQKDPMALSAYVNRGTTQIFLKDYVCALADFDTILQKDPQYVSAYLHRGSVKYYLEDYFGAIADYDRAIALNSADPSYYNFRGPAQLKGNNIEGAISDFTTAIQISPQFSDAYANRGQTLKEKGDLAGAIRDFQQAVEIDPQNKADLFRRSGDIYEELKEPYKALRAYQQALQYEPQNTFALQNRALLLQKMGDNEGSLKDLNQLIQVAPENVEGHFNRGLLYYAKEEPHKAIKDFQQALLLKPNPFLEIEIYGFRAFAKQQLSDEKGMIQDFTEALNRLEIFLEKTPSPEAIEKIFEFLFPKVVYQINQRQYSEAAKELLRFQPYLPKNHPKFLEYQNLFEQVQEALSLKKE
ncbi:MAG: tetratricopeptide repeat protein, partial [Planctomycetota bacterium]